jgi:hypothetical protein
VLDVLYAMFTEAHHTTTGEPAHDADLAAEAIRLARQLHAALPHDTEVSGLLALMLLTEARRPARVGEDNRLIPLDEQDRRRWDRALIDEGRALVERSVVGAPPGPYLVQACIAALHAEAPDTASTDWTDILVLYRLLEIITDHRMTVFAHEAAPPAEPRLRPPATIAGAGSSCAAGGAFHDHCEVAARSHVCRAGVYVRFTVITQGAYVRLTVIMQESVGAPHGIMQRRTFVLRSSLGAE